MFQFLMMLFLLLVLYLVNNIEGFDESSDVKAGEFPFVVLIAGMSGKGNDKKVNRIGTGVLLTESWTLTAAHIFLSLDKKKREVLCVWYGEFTQSPFDTNMFTEVFGLFVHPGFRKTPFLSKDLFSSTNDLALLSISKVYSPGCCGRLSSVNRQALLGLPAKYVGIAKSGDKNHSENDENRKLKFGSGMLTRCGSPVRKWSQNLLCVIPSCETTWPDERYSGSCGDPLFVKDRIVGIFSLSFYTETSYLRTAFTPVDMYLDWIHNVMTVQINTMRKSYQRMNTTV